MTAWVHKECTTINPTSIVNLHQVRQSIKPPLPSSPSTTAAATAEAARGRPQRGTGLLPHQRRRSKCKLMTDDRGAAMATVPGTPPFGRAAPSVRGQRRQVVLEGVRPLQRQLARRQQRSAERPCRRSRLAPSGRAWRCSSPRKRLGPRGGAASRITALSHTGRRPRGPAILFVLAPSLCSVGTALSRRVDGCKLPGRGDVLLGVKFVNLTIFGSFFRHKQVQDLPATAREPCEQVAG